MSQETSRKYFFAILALAFAIRVGYAFVTPPFQAPDEYSHFSYAKFLHDSRQLPVQPSPALAPEYLEMHQPPLFYAVAAPLIPSTKLVEGRPSLPMRFLNILFAMLTVCIAYFFASTVLPHSPFAVAVICTGVAFTPTYSYISSTIRNGVLATFFASLGFYLCAKAVLTEEGQKNARWSWIGVVAGLAILSKLTAVAFVFAAGMLILATSRGWRAALQRSAWFSLGLFATSGWWFVRNWQVYGHWLKVVETGYDISAAPVTWEHERYTFIQIFKTFWAVFGRVNELYFADIYRFYWWFAGIAAIGLLHYAFKGRKDLPATLVGSMALAIGVSLACTMYYAHNYDSNQGRYMFPVLLPIATFIAVGLNSLVPARFHRIVLDVVLFAFVGINLVVLWRMAAFYY